MSLTGVCQVCEAAEGEYTCEQCGAFVCATHYDRAAGLCTNCAAREGGGAR